MITLRKAQIEDSEKLRTWRNLPEIRQNFFNNSKVSAKEHNKWYSNALANPLINIFIASAQNEEVGVLRYDQEADKAVVSIYVLPAFWRKGLGTKILLNGESYLKNTPVKIMEAKVLITNIASQKIFYKAGYKESTRNEQYITLSKDIL